MTDRLTSPFLHRPPRWISARYSVRDLVLPATALITFVFVIGFAIAPSGVGRRNYSDVIQTLAPLGNAIAMSKLLLGTSLDADQREFATIVYDESMSLLGIINDILDLSLIEGGRLVIDSIDFALADVVSRAIRTVSPGIGAKGLRLEVTLDPLIPLRLRGDPQRLRQILLNFVANAVKFTPGGSIVVSVVQDHINDDGIFVRFDVRDTGIGIDSVTLGQLFQPFTQANSSTKRTYGETGLGLAICNRLAEAMGGQVGAESVEGSGSNFWFVARLIMALDDYSVPILDCDAVVRPDRAFSPTWWSTSPSF